MNPTLVKPVGIPLTLRFTTAAQVHRVALLVGLVVAVAMFLLNVFRRESYTGDEGFYGVTALNMVESSDYIVRPSYFPAGNFTEDKHGFAHPPFNSYAYALSLWMAGGSRVGPELLNAVNFGLLLVVVYGLVVVLCGSRVGMTIAAPVPLFARRAALFAVLLVAASPALSSQYSMLEAEPLMTTFGLLALYGVVRGGFDRGRRRWLAASGLALGMAFAFKLWLVGPLALAVGAALVVRMFQARPVWSNYVAGLGAFTTGLIVPAGLHLLVVAVYSPGDLQFWLNNIYFGIFTNAGISGAKLGGGATPSNWVHPVWYYGAALYREHFFLLPPLVFGAGAVAQEVGRWRAQRVPLKPARTGGGNAIPLRIPLAVFAIGFLGVVPLSLLKVKEPLYVLSCAVFLYLLAGVCLAVLARRFAAERGCDRLSLWGGTLVVGGLMLVVVLARLRNMRPDDVTPGFAWGHTLVFASSLLLIHAAHQWKRHAHFTRWVCAVCAVGVAAGIVWKGLSRVPRDSTIAGVLQPYLAGSDPAVLSFVATNFKGFQYLTYRRGMYWHELPEGLAPDHVLATPQYAHVRAFVLGPEDLTRESIRDWMRWLERHTAEITPEVDRALGRVSGYRIFVRNVPPRTPARTDSGERGKDAKEDETDDEDELIAAARETRNGSELL